MFSQFLWHLTLNVLPNPKPNPGPIPTPHPPNRSSPEITVHSCFFEEKWNSNKLVSGRMKNNADKDSCWCCWKCLILISQSYKPIRFFTPGHYHQELWVLLGSYHSPPFPRPHRMDSPNLQLLLANTKTSPGILFDKQLRSSKYDQIRIVK